MWTRLTTAALRCGTSYLDPRRAFRLVACNVPVKVDGIAVTPGDIVVADSSAIAVVPGRVAADVAQGRARMLPQ